MAKSNSLEDAILELLLNATAIANLADNASVSPATNLYVSLHTSDPGEAGDQTTNEATYTSYARVAVDRTGSGWTVVGGSATNDSEITFPTSTGGSNTVTHIGIGRESAGAGFLMYKAALTASKLIETDDTPRFPAGTVTVTEA